MKLLHLTILALLISGCTTKENKLLLNDFKAQHKELSQTLQTQKVTILNSNKEVDGFIVAMYLYEKSGKVTTSKGENEKFIVGIYHDKRSDSIAKPTITLHGVKPMSVRELKSYEPILDGIPLKNRWSRYYETTFPPYKISQNLELEIIDPLLGKATLKFSKSLNFSQTPTKF